MRPTVILFDVGNVILAQCDHEVTYRLLVADGVPRKRAERFYTGPFRAFSRGKLGCRAFGRALQEELGTALPYRRLQAAHDAHFLRADRGVLTVLRSLKQRGYRIGIATDTNPWQTRREREIVDVTAYASPRDVFRSHRLGMLKADRGFFPFVTRRLRVPASAILLVDDSPEKVAAARRSGLRAVLFTGAKPLRRTLRARGIL